MKKYRFLKSGWRKNKRKKSRIFPDFKSRWKKNNHKREGLSQSQFGEKDSSKDVPSSSAFEFGEDMSMFTGRDNGAKRKTKDRKWGREN